MEKNYLKIVWVLAFVAFAAVSCWATAESLHMLLSTWPTIMCWVVTVGFFIIASLGSKMIVDSLNQKIYMEKRGLYLSGGVFLVLVFWLVCSMPTNTHTFFYRTVINDVVANDITTTRGYLGQIINNTKNENFAKEKIEKLETEVKLKLGELEAEIKNEVNPGFGEKSKARLRELASLLDVPSIEPLSYRGTSKQDLDKLCDAYRTKIYDLLRVRTDIIRSSISSPNYEDFYKARNSDYHISKTAKYINGLEEGGKYLKIDLNDPKHIRTLVCDKLNEGYNAIKLNKDFVNFSSPYDEAKYTAEKPINDVSGLLSVFNVWSDFMKGEYAGRGFIYWVLISILVDLAAFIFFDLAFRKTE